MRRLAYWIHRDLVAIAATYGLTPAPGEPCRCFRARVHHYFVSR